MDNITALSAEGSRLAVEAIPERPSGTSRWRGR